MNLYVPKFDKCRLILYSNICTGTILNDSKIIHLVYLRGLFLQIKETEKFEGTLEKNIFTRFIGENAVFDGRIFSSNNSLPE